MRAVVTADVTKAGRKQTAAKYAAVDNSIQTIPVVTFQSDNSNGKRSAVSYQLSATKLDEFLVVPDLTADRLVPRDSHVIPIEKTDHADCDDPFER